MIKKLIWLWKRFWGTWYHIEYTDRLKEDECLFYAHTIYIGIGGKEDNEDIS